MEEVKEKTFMQRILAARKEIAESGISKDKKGFKFNYVDLPQIEQKVNEACYTNNLMCWIDFVEDTAVLAIYDALGSTDCPFVLRVKPKDVKSGNQPIQDTGAMMTYMRRYLYMTAFQISEHDRIDDFIPAETVEEKTTSEKPVEEKTTSENFLAPDDRFKEVTNQKVRAMLCEIDNIDSSYIKVMINYKGVKNLNDLGEKYVTSCLVKLKGEK